MLNVTLSIGALCGGAIAILCVGTALGLFIAALLSANK